MFEYKAVCINVVDGDTFDAVVKLSDESQVIATVGASDVTDQPPQLLSDITSDFGFRITERRIVTLEVDTDLPGYHIVERRIKQFEQRVRLYGIDTPERGAPGAAEATDALRLYVIGFETIPLTIATVKPHDKYGRWLATVATPQCPDVAAAMIERGLGTPYFGEKKPPAVP